jgi:riboflavin synthase
MSWLWVTRPGREVDVFTGIVEATGVITAVEENDAGVKIRLSATGLDGAIVGESIAVDGVCLTVADVGPDDWSADVMKVTRETTTLGAATAGRRVNLERALRADSRMGGHIVQGHVDGVATLIDRNSGPEWEDFVFEIPTDLSKYVVSKGSIAVDGVSLTVAALDGDKMTVSLIPTTLEVTCLGDRRPGDRVNIEVDVIGKYVERLLGRGDG